MCVLYRDYIHYVRAHMSDEEIHDASDAIYDYIDEQIAAMAMSLRMEWTAEIEDLRQQIAAIQTQPQTTIGDFTLPDISITSSEPVVMGQRALGGMSHHTATSQRIESLKQKHISALDRLMK